MSSDAPNTKHGGPAPVAAPAADAAPLPGQARRTRIIKIALAVAVLAVAGLIASRALTPVPGGLGDVETMWFYDIADAKLVALPDSIPPVTTSKGRAVRAYVFSCGSCADRDTLVTAYYEMFNPEAQTALHAAHVMTYSELASEPRDNGRLVTNDPKGNWFAVNSKEGRAITAGARKCPDGKPATKLCLGPDTK
jgi:hypothetical protein